MKRAQSTHLPQSEAVPGGAAHSQRLIPVIASVGAPPLRSLSLQDTNGKTCAYHSFLTPWYYDLLCLWAHEWADGKAARGPWRRCQGQPS